MPEIKNTFLEGKMNKDLDARLLKNGEYFDAQNIHITKSEGSDVGTVQNILGNKLNYTTGAFKSGERTIGIVTTNTTNGTNAAGAGYSGTPNATSGFTTSGSGVGGSVNIIIDGGTVTKVTFSGTSSGYKVGDTITISKDTGTPAIGGSTSVVLTLREEDLLITEDVGTVIGFFVDSEKKNIYYFVKGNSKHKDNIYYYQEGSATAPILLINNSTDFLKFDTDFLITGVNVIDELLFWTDNKNQPRKINTVTAVNNTSYYNNEDKISVARYYPYTAPKVLRQVDGTDHTGIQKLKHKATLNGAVNSAKVLVITQASDTNHEIHPGMEVFDGATALNAKVESVSADGLTINVDANISKSDGTVLTFINQNDRLKEKFVRFAYRFQFKDSEYSLISPFTQHCFIPQTYNSAYDGHDAQGRGLTTAQEVEASKSTILESMINDASHVNLQIDFPSASPTTDFEIEKIEILIKESNRPDIKSLAQLNITDASVANDKVYNYTYKGSLPYKTLPEQQLTRVYDNVPTKAKAQEIISNRVVYGNYQEGSQNKPYDTGLNYSFDYTLAVGDKSDTQKFTTQYPYHTIKTRRSYQVGVVLADRYGRQSPVFLSDSTENSIIAVAAQNSTETATSWNGQNLEITFNKRIPETDEAGRSVLYSATNPTGWYTYKIVVKQNEYEYYNIYAPMTLHGFPDSGTMSDPALFYADEDKRSWLVLHGDNVNKVPRDTTEGSTEENSIFPTDVNLYPKIRQTVFTNSNSGANNNTLNTMDDGPLVNITSIGKALDHGLDLHDGTGSFVASNQAYTVLYNFKKNPLLAEMPNGFGYEIAVTAGNSQSPLNFRGSDGLSVWETKGFESALDIYYETVTCGLISELNAEILQGPGASGVPTSIKFSDGTTQANLAENLTAGNVVGSTHLETFNQGPNGTTPAEITGITYSVIQVLKNGTEIDTTGNLFFDIQDAGNNQQQLKTTSNFAYFGTSSDTYTVRIKAEDNSNNSTIQDFSIFVINSTPAITLPDSATHPHFQSNRLQVFLPLSAVNGSADTTQNTSNLTFSITGVIFDPDGTPSNASEHAAKFSINAITGAVAIAGHRFPDTEVGKKYRITVQVNDNSGQTNNVASGTCDVEIGLWMAYVNKLYASSPAGVCGVLQNNSPSDTFFIKRPSTITSTSLSPQIGDLVYTDAAGTTSAGNKAIITIPMDDGTYDRVAGGTIQAVGEDNGCTGYPGN